MNNELFAAMRQLSKAASGYLHPILDIPRQLSDALKPLTKEAWEPFQEIFHQLNQVQRILADILEGLPKVIRRALVLLGQHGWYTSLEMPTSAIYKLANLVQEGNYSEVDRWMVGYYETNLDSIEDSVEQKFPHRAKILKAAFGAHKHREYELSIPVFLSQADGICYELINIQLYGKKNGRPRTADFVDQFAVDSILTAVMEPLRTALPISATSSDREGEDYPPESLNRHQILHGESVDYGTQINSCKAISLLCYVCEILDRTFFDQDAV